MCAYLPVADPLTPEWLTAVLRQSGVLHQGEVRTVQQETTGAFNSRTRRLSLRYSADAAPDLPAHLILKQDNQTAWGIEAGAQEVRFYRLVSSLRNHPPVTVPCYAAAQDELNGASYLLMQDISETHRPPITRDQQISIVEGVPAPAYVEAVVDTLAQLHAYWWEHALLETGGFEVGYWSRNADRFQQYLHRRRTAWESLIAAERAWFPADLRELYEHVLAHLPRYWERYLEPRFRTRRNLTLVHGDAYFANFLCPRNPGAGATYLIDWQSPGVDLAGYDLANLIAAFWTPEQRHAHQREETMLRRYHTRLQQEGVSHFAWDELQTDYQAGLIFWLLMPVQDCYGGAGRDYWWPKMQCLTAAFQEWHCGDLLGL